MPDGHVNPAPLQWMGYTPTAPYMSTATHASGNMPYRLAQTDDVLAGMPCRPQQAMLRPTSLQSEPSVRTGNDMDVLFRAGMFTEADRHDTQHQRSPPFSPGDLLFPRFLPLHGPMAIQGGHDATTGLPAHGDAMAPDSAPFDAGDIVFPDPLPLHDPMAMQGGHGTTPGLPAHGDAIGPGSLPFSPGNLFCVTGTPAEANATAILL